MASHVINQSGGLLSFLFQRHKRDVLSLELTQLHDWIVSGCASVLWGLVSSSSCKHHHSGGEGGLTSEEDWASREMLLNTV